MPRLIWSPSSRRDLRNIDIYLVENDAAAAPKMLRAIRAAADRLIDHPRIGRATTDPIGVRGTPYLILYRRQVGGVEIVRIRRGSENWLAEVEAHR